MLHADLHLHTAYSPDSATSLEKVIATCLKKGINCLAVTDHNSISGALEIKQRAPFKVIVGEEVRTTEGEIIGLFLTREVPRGLTPQDAAARIKAQGGLVCVPHPFDRLRRHHMEEKALEGLFPHIDLLEVFNARTTLHRDNLQAKAFAQKHGLPMSAGSDAHTPGEIGGAYVEMPDFEGQGDFLSALRQGHIVGHEACFLVHFYSSLARLGKKLRRG
ncbi:MAG: PHP domain-containing protein [Chloroflexota bacterium]|nr:PHP domain-containing protein [Chloroflexota bacterium]